MAELGIGLVDKLIEAIASPVIEKICHTWGYKSQLADLKETVDTVKTVLLTADSMQDLGKIQQEKIDDLKDVVYDADDLFDEFLTLAELKQLNINEDDQFLKKVSQFFSSMKKKLSQAHKMSEMVKEIKKRLDSIDDNHKKFNLNLDMKPYRERRVETCSHLNEKVVGREDDKQKVVKMLLSPDVSFLTIVGMGGLGKTTLAKLVFQHEVIQEEFPESTLRFWVCVSDQNGEEFNVQDILCKILALHLGEKQFDGNCSLELVKNKFEEKLRGKKYLIVLDDVWNENIMKWNFLESLLMVGQRRSRILITTRSKRTSNIIGKFEYELDGLSQEHSWSLFKSLAFGKEKENRDIDEFVELGKKIVEKCHNVPLAIQVVGSLLRGQDIFKWRSLEGCGMNEISNGNNKIMSILKLSYYNLDPSLKRCFSYCALYPKDTKILKETLISLWMAQGYIVPFDGGQSLEDAAEEHFWTLLQRCFFQDVEKDVYGNVMSIKIHDLMHDVAQDVGRQEICVLTSKSSILVDKIRHINVGGRQQPPEGFVFKNNIRSFLCHFHRKFLMELRITDNMMCLRVLDLEHSSLHKLPDWIDKLLHLRYINLSWNQSIETLPDSITKLHNLQTLILYNCTKLRELPKDFGKLVKLRHLDLSGCRGLISMPPSMEKLCNMRVLPYFVVGKGSAKQGDGELEILKSFTNIKRNIHIEIGENYKKLKGMNSRGVGYLKSTKYLTTIEIEFCDRRGQVDQEDVMEKLEPNSNLKEFIVKGYRGKIIPRWGTAQSNWAISFPHLVKIKLDCRELKQMPSLGKLQYLKSLVLVGLELEYMEATSNISRSDGNNSSTTFFPSLESLQIDYLKNLKGWWRGEDDVGGDILMSRRFKFPKLSHLQITNCDSLTSSFPICPVLENLTLLRNKINLPKIVNLPEEKEDYGEISADEEVRGLKKIVTDSLYYLKAMFVDHEPLFGDEIPWKSLNQSLYYLHFKEARYAAYFPRVSNGAQYLTSLHTLKFDCCYYLFVLPEWIGNLSSLQHLSIDCCWNLESLPESMKKLTSIQTLEIRLCPKLEKRCKKPDGEDWSKIQHIPKIHI